MPQMVPINWLFLFILFCTIFLLFMMMNYFLMSPNTPSLLNNKNNKMNKSLNWKW